MSDANARDLTDIDLLDKERENVAKARAASYAQKAFTPSFDYQLSDAVIATDAATADEDTAAHADTVIATDYADALVTPSAKFRFGSGDLQSFTPNSNKKIRGFAGRVVRGRHRLFFGFGSWG